MRHKVKPMLAAKGGAEDFIYPCWLSPKLDGIRGLATTRGAQSRSGEPFKNIELREIMGRLPAGLDGEIVTGHPMDPESFHRTTSVVNSFHGSLEDTHFYVYDNFWQGYGKPVIERLEELRELIILQINTFHDLALFVLEVPQEYVETREQAERYIEAKIAEGYEGVCSRAARAGYKYGRCARAEHGLIAYKEFVDCEVTILWVEEKQTNGNTLDESNLGYAKRSSHADGKTGAGTMGRMWVRAINGEFDGVEFFIGRGCMTDAEAKSIWEAAAIDIVGQIATIKYQSHGSKDKPRSPIFRRWRLDAELSA